MTFARYYTGREIFFQERIKKNLTSNLFESKSSLLTAGSCIDERVISVHSKEQGTSDFSKLVPYYRSFWPA